ncbi:MAG: cation:proton antiporter [Candidatus Sulfotelmatobacter sp.]
MLNLVTLILQMAVVLGLCRLVGDVFVKIRQPRVNGEMFAGILLGPSLLGWVAPQFSRYLFPPASFDFLNALGQLGVVLFMFLAGLAIDPAKLKSQAKATVSVTFASIGAPMLLAFALAAYLHPRFSSPDVNFVNFALLLGAAMTITAFPMLAKLLLERNMLSSPLGAVAVGSACVAGVFTWCVLAYVVARIKNPANKLGLYLTFVGILLFTAAMFCVVKPLLKRFGDIYSESGVLNEKAMAIMMVIVVAASVCSGYLGLHPLFGAFLVGAVMPKTNRFGAYVTGRLEVITTAVLLPLYLAFSGLRTNLLTLRGAQMWLITGLIILVAILGKVAASALAGWASGMKLREAAGLGSLLNMRGLICLIVLNIGLDLKVINSTIFSMMVVMALVNTFLTLPMFDWFCPRQVQKAVEMVPATPLDYPIYVPAE